MSLGDNEDAGSTTAPGGSRRPEPGDAGQEAPWLLRQAEQGTGWGGRQGLGRGPETGKVDREMKEAKPPTGQTDLVWILIQASQL